MGAPPESEPGRWQQLGVRRAISPTDAWAVGSYISDGSDRALILHWDGGAWEPQPSPERGSEGSLFGVAATSRRNAWAVGSWYDSSGPSRTLILHWDGRTWERQRSPNEPGWDYNQLYAVAASSGEDAWAVGCYDDGWWGSPLMLHWNGSAWRID